MFDEIERIGFWYDISKPKIEINLEIKNTEIESDHQINGDTKLEQQMINT
jgi:hypothetical protein